MAKYDKNLYQARKLRGICVGCGKDPARPGRVYCMACAVKRSAYYFEKTQHMEYGPMISEGGKHGKE